MHSITYVSSSVQLRSDEELLTLLRLSRDRNAEFGITGMLLYKSGNFIQSIEGPEAPIRQLYKNICNDRSHHYVTTLLNEKIPQRAFPDWSMGFATFDHPRISGFSDFLKRDADLRSFCDQPQEAKLLLLNFRNVIRYAWFR